VAEALKHAPRLSHKRVILVNLSGRGDKDVESVLATTRPASAGDVGDAGDAGGSEMKSESFAAAAAARRAKGGRR
jgi:hypothetical protein